MKLVLADSNRLFVDLLKSALVPHGLAVAAFATRPEDVAAMVGRYAPDVCLLAARFPGGSGLDVLRMISRRYPRSKVVLFSASSGQEEMADAFQAGAAAYIPKGLRIADFLHVLSRVGRGERVFDAHPTESAAGNCTPVVTAGASRPGPQLTEREQEVLMQIMEGEGTRQIARSLAIAESTTRTHVQNVLAKLGVHSRLEAANVVARSGLLGGPALIVQAVRVTSGQ